MAQKRFRDMANASVTSAASNVTLPAGFMSGPDDLNSVAAELSHDFVDSFTVQHIPEIDTEFAKRKWSQDPEASGVLDDIVGRWWRVGTINNTPVWRQEKGPDSAGWWMWHEVAPPLKGWVVSPELMNASDTHAKAWGKHTPGHLFPGFFNVPFNASKVCHLVNFQVSTFSNKSLDFLKPYRLNYSGTCSRH